LPEVRQVAVIGVGQTAFGERWEASFRDLVTEAGLKAIQDARVTGEEIDAVYVGSVSAGQYIGQEHVAALVVDHAGFSQFHTPATRVEGSGASGALAFRQAVLAVMSGAARVAIAGGIEKMTDVSEARAARIRGSSLDQEWEAFVGATDAALHALMAKAYMAEHGSGVEALEAVAIKNHAHGTKNPYAMFQREVKLEAVRLAPMVAEPFTTMHCAAISDGAAAVIVCPLEEAESYTKKPVLVAGTGQGSDTLALHGRSTLTSMPAARRAAERAYQQAGCGPKDIDVAEVHDAYTINELIALEDLGLTDRGDAARATLDGETRLGGVIPTNPSGGLKARGHPVGATGLAQLAEITLQMRGEGGARQVKGARRGLAHNTGGTGATAAVTILEAM
jgi:acetyl-CoA C-acetyltransferase